MADSSISIKDAAGATQTVDTFAITGGDHHQVIRQAKATAKTNNSWTITTSGQTSQIAADATRVGMWMLNFGSGRVYLRWDSTMPTSTVCDQFLEAGDRYEVPEYAVTLAVSVLGQFAGGTLYTALFASA
jgi:hypothetical protein